MIDVSFVPDSSVMNLSKTNCLTDFQRARERASSYVCELQAAGKRDSRAYYRNVDVHYFVDHFKTSWRTVAMGTESPVDCGSITGRLV